MSSLLKRLVQLVLLVVAVLLIRHYVFSPAAVNGSSMEPTLHNNDRLWVTSIKSLSALILSLSLVLATANE